MPDTRALYLAQVVVLPDGDDRELLATDVGDLAVDVGVLIGPPIQNAFSISNTPTRIGNASNDKQHLRIENQGAKTALLIFANIGNAPTILSTTPGSLLAAGAARDFSNYLPNTDIWAITPTTSDTTTLYVEEGY